MHRAIVLTLLFAIQSWSAAYGWGDEGHRITGYIADELLTATARAELRKIGDDDLAQIATWLDDQRDALEQRYRGSSRWHYENRPACGSSSGGSSTCPRGQCITRQIERSLAVLDDRQAGRAQRVEALRILVHLLGDLHQPLHLADNGDRGGNDTYVLLPNDGRPRRLHEAWDTRFLRMNLRRRDEQAYAHSLLTAHRSERTAWKNGDIAAWAMESYTIGTRHAYDLLPGFACGRHDSAPIRLPSSYIEQAREDVDVQLVKAGVRIAEILNRALDR